MNERVQRQIDAWAGSKALTVLSRLASVAVLPLVGLLFTMHGRIATLEQQIDQLGREKERRLLILETAQQRTEVFITATGRGEAATAERLLSIQRTLDRLERILDRRAEAPP